MGWVPAQPMMVSLVLTAASVAGPGLRPLLDAIRQVETGGCRSVSEMVGDDGRSLGPYQIQEPYWRDSGIPGRYGDVRHRAYAETVMLAYWKRHCPNALARGDYRTLARIHNGGPTGDRRAQTLRYWQKVSRELKRH